MPDTGLSTSPRRKFLLKPFSLLLLLFYKRKQAMIIYQLPTSDFQFKHRLIMTLYRMLTAGTICIPPVVTVTRATAATCSVRIVCMTWLTLMIISCHISTVMAVLHPTSERSDCSCHRHCYDHTKNHLLHNFLHLLRVVRNFYLFVLIIYTFM